ncbi:MAG: hypothetical protein WA188_22475 [Terriglobales bacterium]
MAVRCRLKKSNLRGCTRSLDFGKVLQGQNIADKIANAPRGAQDRPAKEVKLKAVTIERV